MNGQQAASSTPVECTTFSYQQTGYFTKTIKDYLDNKETLQPFYQHEVSLEGIKAAIQQRQGFSEHREVLVKVLREQYKGLSLSSQVEQNIQLLLQPNTFTITTAHQPVIFTGPLFFTYKILHAVKLAQTLREQLADYHFVPVFYMGSEDADIDELGSMSVDGKTYKWQTKQTGAVGRMKVDNAFLHLLQQLENQVNVLPLGEDIISIFKRCYRFGTTIQQATLEVVNELFGEYGVVVLIPDNKDLKCLLDRVFRKEIEEQFSHKEVEKTLAQLSRLYKVQAGGRELNLFYLLDDSRERIEKKGDAFVVQNKGLHFTKEQLLEEINNHPERFSPNVILRGVLQETVLPNVAFIGGGGELAYWLELKGVFNAAQVPYPVLVLRNSFLVINEKQQEKIAQLHFAATDFFKDSLSLIDDLVKRTSENTVSIENEIEEVKGVLAKLKQLSAKVDVTLGEHTLALSGLFEKKLMALQKKIVREERRKYTTQHQQIETIKLQLFPNGSLQERVENVSAFYALYNKAAGMRVMVKNLSILFIKNRFRWSRNLLLSRYKLSSKSFLKFSFNLLAFVSTSLFIVSL